MPSDQRDSERLPMLGELRGEIMVFQPMRVTEVSRGGTLVETGFPLHLNSLHELRLSLGDRSVVVKGRVAHSSICDVDQDIVTYRSGLEFVEPPERVATAITEFLDSLKIGRGAPPT